MLKKMPVPIITGVSTIVKHLDNDKIIEENGTANESTEDEEQTKKQEEDLEKGQDCLEKSTEAELIEIGDDFEDVTQDVTTTAKNETTAVPAIEIQTSNGNSDGFIENTQGMLEDSSREGNALVTALRAVETVPCTSYSSSDDDDEDDDEAEFFDANEYTGEMDLQSEQVKR